MLSNTQRQDALGIKYENGLTFFEKIKHNPETIKAILEYIIDYEISRLRESINSVLFTFGMLGANDSKITALELLKDIWINGHLNDIEPYDLQRELIQWKNSNEECVATQRNHIHSIFSPSHKSSLADTVNIIFEALGINTPQNQLKYQT